jgi:hypothetical protein
MRSVFHVMFQSFIPCTAFKKIEVGFELPTKQGNIGLTRIKIKFRSVVSEMKHVDGQTDLSIMS